MDYLVNVRDFIVENFLFGDGDRFADDTSFLDSGIIDSTGILELIEYLERTYAITIRDHEIIPENLDSVINIDRFLKRRLSGPQEEGVPVSENLQARQS